jgi:hypothetical protein
MFNGGFELPRRETPKNAIKQNREKIGFGFFGVPLGKNFSTWAFGKRVDVVLLNPHRRETPKSR